MVARQSAPNISKRAVRKRRAAYPMSCATQSPLQLMCNVTDVRSGTILTAYELLPYQTCRRHKPLRF